MPCPQPCQISKSRKGNVDEHYRQDVRMEYDKTDYGARIRSQLLDLLFFSSIKKSVKRSRNKPFFTQKFPCVPVYKLFPKLIDDSENWGLKFLYAYR